ncbi:helix-turn-helix transcriptional regulator [Trabulsiella odontotermitis]|uniref:helix-turn-helix transcriptional regulator n=1 Tax=Trabulsiella odontotermitis TaxID=379893 RepID=UPI000676758C|nr:AraC family transcriptional regulator [Trabulsiella odontotermitis]KNC89932.1 AraC family transcriptional regulator [Trabulsiella odontotermitis]
MKQRIHQVRQYRRALPGVEAVSLLTAHSFPRHSHDQFGIGVFVEGAQRSQSCIGNVEASAGNIIMVNPGEIHDGVPLTGIRGWHMLYIEPDVMTGELNGQLDVKPVANDSVLSASMQQLFLMLNAPTPDRTAIEEAVMQCLMRVTKQHLLSVTPRNACSPSIALAKEYLDDSPAEPVTLAALAGLCGISRFQLIRGFSRDVGTTPHAWLIQSRVRLAKRLLQQGARPIDAALQAGFADQSHLTRAFRRQFGMTPGQYVLSLR